MAQMASDGSNKRRHQDIMKLMMSDYEVHIPDDTVAHDFVVKFRGPTETPYEGGVWKVHVVLPREYPYKSPSIGFLNSIFHPNIDEMSGSVCLDVINQTWSPMYSTSHVPRPRSCRNPRRITPATVPCAFCGVPCVRLGQHFRHVLATSPPLPECGRPLERRRGGAHDS